MIYLRKYSNKNRKDKEKGRKLSSCSLINTYSIKTGRYVYLYQQESIPTHNHFGAKLATNLVQDDTPNSQNTFPTIYELCILTANIPFLGVYPMHL